MLYLLFGEEDRLVQEELERLQAGLGPADLISLNRMQLEAAQLNFAELQAYCSTVAFLAPARLIIVNGLLTRFERGEREGGVSRARGRGNAARAAFEEWQRLDELVPTMPETTHLVLLDGKIDPRNPLLQLLRPHAQVRQFPKLRGSAKEQWVRQRAKSLEATFAPGALQLLLQVAGDNLWSLSNELEKLALYAQGGHIKKEDVTALVPEAREATVFQLVDMVAEGEVRQAQRSLFFLSQDGAAPPYLLFMLARQFRLLLLAKALQAQGVKGAPLQAQLGIPSGYVFQKVMTQERRYDVGTLKRIMQRLLEADVALKTGTQKGEIVLELLVVDLCGRSRVAHQL